MSMPAVPSTIGRYRVESVVGEGAMGVVYRALDPEIERYVAIKVVRANLLGSLEAEHYRDRFRREIQAASRCFHPNVVTIYDIGSDGGNPYFVMEFIDGVSLEKLIPSGGVASFRAISVILQVLSALERAHSLGIVHRDIKPANIVFASADQIKVMDFGISRLISGSLTQAGSMMGTPNYMSPEQLRGEPVDAASDIYSVGALLHELLVGVPPYTGRDFENFRAKALFSAAVTLPELSVLIPERLREVVAKAIAFSPSERFATATLMIEALKHAQSGFDSVDSEKDWGEPVRQTQIDTLNPAFSPTLLSALEVQLMEYVGPIARRMVKDAAGSHLNYVSLCNELASRIENRKEREVFFKVALETAQIKEIESRPNSQSGVAMRDVGSAIISQSGGQAPAGWRSVAPEIGKPTVDLLDPLFQEKVTHLFADFIGPIAKRIVRDAATSGQSYEEFCALLAHYISNNEERSNFSARLDRLHPSSTLCEPESAGRTSELKQLEKITPELIDRLKIELSNYIGPIAELLIKREAASSGNARELLERLALYIPNELERTRFISGFET